MIALKSSKIAGLLGKKFRTFHDTYPILKMWSTGLASLDYILSGGLPEGRIIELYGKPSSGKSSLAMYVAREHQLRGGIIVYIDAEKSIND